MIERLRRWLTAVVMIGVPTFFAVLCSIPVISCAAQMGVDAEDEELVAFTVDYGQWVAAAVLLVSGGLGAAHGFLWFRHASSEEGVSQE
jgi:hypothetical protein